MDFGFFKSTPNINLSPGFIDLLSCIKNFFAKSSSRLPRFDPRKRMIFGRLVLSDSLSTSFNVSNAGGNLPVEIHPQGSHNICEGDSFYILTDRTYCWGRQFSTWSSGIYFIQTMGNEPFTTKVIIL